MIPYARQDISQTDIDAVVAVLRSDFLTQGPLVPAFEKALAARCQVSHAVAVNSATSALHLACLALELGPGDVMWTSPITFVATANCARYCGAEVDFVDIDPLTFNLSPAALENKLQQAANTGRLPKVVIAVHMCGQSCDMVAIHALAQAYGFKLIEDASHAIGATYQGRPVGNCRYSDISILSFHPVKIITTAEGGAALTNQEDLARRMALLRAHGVTRDAKEMTGSPEGGWSYEQIALGLNYRMTDLQAALGLSQLQRLDEFVARRCWLANAYGARLADKPLILPWQSPDGQSSWHLYVVGIMDRKRRYDGLRAREIGVNVHYMPVYRQPYYAAMGFRAVDFPCSENYYRHALTLPLYPGMGEAQLDQVALALQEVLQS